MIVLGADTHKRSHTIAAVSAATGELLGEQTVQVGAKGFAALVVWARGLAASGCGRWRTAGTSRARFERFLIDRGERVVRVTTKLMADSRRGARGRGKSDSIDAIAVARAALREGLDALPAAQLDGPELDLRLLVDHRERLVRQRVGAQQHAAMASARPLARAAAAGQLAVLRHLGPAHRAGGSPAPSRRCASASPATSCAASASSRRRSRRSRPRSPSSSPRSRRSCSPSPGFGPLTAAKLVGEIAGADRFATDAKLARAAGIAPIPVSSGNTNRHRLDRGGNRQINATIHRIAVTRLAATPRPRTTSPANAPKARPPRKPSAASNATSPAASGTCSSRPTPTKDTAITINLLT